MASRAAAPRLYSIPPGVPWLATFARAFLDGGIVPGFGAHVGPLRLSGATIFVPTRRAARALAVEFSKLTAKPVTLLPRIVPLGQIDAIETSLMFEEARTSALPDDLPNDLPEAIGEMQRRLDLARLILAFAAGLRAAERAEGAPLIAPGPAHAFRLAGDLAGLMDEMTIEGVDWGKLETLAPREFDRYWELTLKFLRIATTIWPDHLRDVGRMDRAERQVRLIDGEIARIAARADEPVVAIGSTGTNKSTARLLAALARAPMGAVVLPGLDTWLDEKTWAMIPGDPAGRVEANAGHPQMMLNKLLETIGATRADVVEIGQPDAALQARRNLVSEALRPADTTDAWRSFPERMNGGAVALALEEITLVEAADDREEALAIALLMREALETEAKTCSLITPDRALAARVRCELARWDIHVDDSGGERLGTTPEGALADLLLACALEPQPSIALLALLTHPLFRIGREARDIERLGRLIDVSLLRMVLPDEASIAELMTAAQKAASGRDSHPAAQRIGDEDWRAIEALLGDIEALLAPLRGIGAGQPLSAYAKAHLGALQGALNGAEGLTPAIETLQELLDELSGAGERLPVDLESYGLLFKDIGAELAVRGPTQSHPRLKILGLLEARLMPCDLALLGGLDETVWPPQSSADAFLNRPMRAELGLSSPERRIGQTAHDFAQAMGAREIVITRAQKRGGSPTVPSRFLQRLAALAGDVQWSQCKARGERALALARLIDGDEAEGARARRPAPRPKLELRPTSLSVTRIETLRRDPYSIYAERILKLKPLEPIGAEAGARESGILLHDVLSRFVIDHPKGRLAPGAEAELVERARTAFSDLMRNAAFRAFTWPRHAFAMTRFIDWENGRRDDIADIDTEQYGRLPLTLADGSIFTLTGVADRIEHRKDGGLIVVDYKSGRVPSPKEIKAGFSPQLTLEAAMIARGAFEKVRAQEATAALYVKIGGAKGVEEKEVKSEKDQSFDELVQDQFEELHKLLSQFRDEATPYVPRPFPQFTNAYGAYDHLARLREWSAGGEGGE